MSEHDEDEGYWMTGQRWSVLASDVLSMAFSPDVMGAMFWTAGLRHSDTCAAPCGQCEACLDLCRSAAEELADEVAAGKWSRRAGATA